ncbi:hypothetical protein Zmor_004418 [Zophobas morio]|uniref:Cell division control protein 73 C-terminal domain-containing protein n=1 Tax=Zophobas morio TaxID=2755281 RepID=A0AA38HKH7_9CUCU|nr:hypothetical protein Zmor_004418 [Zophobas morio]
MTPWLTWIDFDTRSFTPSSEARAAMGQKPPMVVVYRKMHGGRTVPFHVYDQTHKFTQEQWDRVCAIFIVGMAWQFKGFPFNSDAVKNLNKFRGYFLAFNDPLFTIPENIHKWDVCVLKVNKRDRDIDATAYTEFWEDLDKFWSHRTGKPIMN